jgi:hypothetical protein
MSLMREEYYLSLNVKKTYITLYRDGMNILRSIDPNGSSGKRIYRELHNYKLR